MAGNTQFGRCFNWLWLFEVDIQLCLFFTSLLLVYIRFTSRKARALFYSLQVVTLIASVVSQSLLNVPMPISEYYYRHEFFGLSITPFGRVGAYVVGYNLGLMFFEFRKL